MAFLGRPCHLKGTRDSSRPSPIRVTIVFHGNISSSNLLMEVLSHVVEVAKRLGWQFELTTLKYACNWMLLDFFLEP